MPPDAGSIICSLEEVVRPFHFIATLADARSDQWCVFAEILVSGSEARHLYFLALNTSSGTRIEHMLAGNGLDSELEGAISSSIRLQLSDAGGKSDFPTGIQAQSPAFCLAISRAQGDMVVDASCHGPDFGLSIAVDPAGGVTGRVILEHSTADIASGQVWCPNVTSGKSLIQSREPILIIPSEDGGIIRIQGGEGVEVTESWTSGLTFETYPTRFRLKRSEQDFAIDALFAPAEAGFLDRSHPKWIGWVRVAEGAGQNCGQRLGVLVQSGSAVSPIHSYLERVNSHAYQTLDRLLPFCDREANPAILFDSVERSELLLENIPSEILNPVLKPISEILQRGRQAWRGVMLGLCWQAVGGKFEANSEWLVFAEMLHTGALIVDDVQDDAPVRRGKPACHVLYGSATAINSGSLAYFLVQQTIERSALDDKTRARVYAEYLGLLRIGHIGQGIDHQIDIDNLPDDVTDDQLTRIETQIRYCDLFKSGVPFRAYARIGSILGGGSDQQVMALGNFFQSVGTAFQLVDDVLNIRGQGKDDAKRAEDLRRGRVTRPVVAALRSVKGKSREALCRSIRTAKHQPRTAGEVADVIRDMETTDGILGQTYGQIDAAYIDLRETIHHGVAMRLIRDVSFCVLQRHY